MAGSVEGSNPIGITVGLYGGLLGIALLMIGGSFVTESRNSAIRAQEDGHNLGVSAFLDGFESNIWWKPLPIQNWSTSLAWPSVTWEIDEMPL
jgi:hypothetical protein